MGAFVSPLLLSHPNRLLRGGSHSSKKRRRFRPRASMDDVDISPPNRPNQPILFSALRSTLVQVFNPPPAPVVLARPTLDQEFAVLLMRAGYNVVDDLNFVAMDEFQARFFDIRSREWEKFIQNNMGMRQGIITDPRYFDFISYAQMLTIQSFIREPRTMFEEKFGDEDGNWGKRVVRRDLDLLQTPQDILYAWRRGVGDRIYQKMLNTARCPQPIESADAEALTRGISDIYSSLRTAGFCLQFKISQEGSSIDTIYPSDSNLLVLEEFCPEHVPESSSFNPASQESQNTDRSSTEATASGTPSAMCRTRSEGALRDATSYLIDAGMHVDEESEFWIPQGESQEFFRVLAVCTE